MFFAAIMICTAMFLLVVMLQIQNQLPGTRKAVMTMVAQKMKMMDILKTMPKLMATSKSAEELIGMKYCNHIKKK